MTWNRFSAIVLVWGLSVPVLGATNPPGTSGPAVEDSKPGDPSAARKASTSADAWAGSIPKTEPTKPVMPPDTSVPPPAPVPAPTPAKVQAEPEAPPTPPAKVQAEPQALPPPRTGLNEMRGKINSVSDNPQIFRVNVDGQFNAEFTYDKHTVIRNGSSLIKMTDLKDNDDVTVRYAGGLLNAVEIERHP